MMSTERTVLLPPGLVDLLPPQARHARLLYQHVMDSLSAFGYQEVSPPLMEFEDSLIDTDNTALSTQTFRVMDPVSRRMLGVRTDMTMQIGRIASTRLADSPLPLRLCYGGRCLRVSGEGLRKEREVVQAGAELIGADQVEADIEMLRCAVATLTPLDMGKITIDINLPNLAQTILRDVEDGCKEAALQAISLKDASALRDLPTHASTLIKALLISTGSTADDSCWEDILKLADSQSRILLAQWLIRVKAISDSHLDADISLDALEQQGFEYYDGLAFSLFARKVDSEVGRGGRYRLNNEVDAVGFTLFLHQLCDAELHTKPAMVCYVLHDNNEVDVARLRSKGWTTIYALDNTGNEHTKAAISGCTHILKSGALLPVTDK